MIWWQVVAMAFGFLILTYTFLFGWVFFFARSINKHETNLLLSQLCQTLETILQALKTTYEQKPLPGDNQEQLLDCDLSHGGIQVHHLPCDGGEVIIALYKNRMPPQKTEC